jgi:pimeloyl-ACP methyl ester carboxylesterase
VQAGAHKSVVAEPPADRELPLTHARLRFRDEGAGPAIVLIHGWTLDLDMWEPQARALSDSFRLIRFDRRGFGLSSGRPSLAHDIADVRSLSDHLGLRSFALLGMSQGARIAAHVAAQWPERVSCVVFDGPPSGTLSDGALAEEEIPVATYRELARQGRIEELRNEWRKHSLVQLHNAPPSAQELLSRMLSRYRAVDLLEAADSSLAPARIESIPALVISGELDLASRIASADALAAVLPSCERAVVPGAGHLPNLDQPHFYNALLRRFLQRFAT